MKTQILKKFSEPIPKSLQTLKAAKYFQYYGFQIFMGYIYPHFLSKLYPLYLT